MANRNRTLRNQGPIDSTDRIDLWRLRARMITALVCFAITARSLTNMIIIASELAVGRLGLVHRGWALHQSLDGPLERASAMA